MITVELATRLRTAGPPWTPGSGDRFVIADRGMDGEVLVVSELTIEVHDAPPASCCGSTAPRNGSEQRNVDVVAERAYARALLAWLNR